MNYALQEDVLEFFQREFHDFLALMGELESDLNR